jgi:hypothetical protein
MSTTNPKQPMLPVVPIDANREITQLLENSTELRAFQQNVRSEALPNEFKYGGSPKLR